MAGWPPEKNATFTWFFVLRDADGDLIAGATSLDVEFSIDGGAFVNVAGAEVDEGEGLYSCPILAAEMNGDVISLICKTATAGVKTAAVVIYTSTRQIDDLAFPATTGRSIQVETDGMIHADLKEWLSVAPLALVSQRVRTQVELITANVINAASINAAALTAAKFGAGAIDANAIATDAIGTAELAATAVQKIVDGILDELSSSHVIAGSVGEVLDNLPNDGALTNLDVLVSSRATPAQVQTELGVYDGPTEAEMNTAHALLATPAQVLSNSIQALLDVGLVLINTTVESVVNGITFVLPDVDASPDDDAYQDCIVMLIDQADATQLSPHGVLSFTASNRRLVVNSTPTFTIVTGDKVIVLSTQLSSLILSDQTPFQGGNIGDILFDTDTTLPALIGTLQSDTDDIQTRLPAALVNSRMNSEVGTAGFTQGAADKVWLSASRTLTAISTAVALPIWQVLETAILTAGSIGLKLKANVDALISSRSSHSASDVTTDIDANSTQLIAIKLKTDALPSGPAKNVALSNFPFLMILSSDDVTPGIGLTITGEISKDGGAFVALTNAEVEIANGIYQVDIIQAEMDADTIVLKFTAPTANQTTLVLLTT